MDNQHKKIKGYRDLSQEEIDLMNEIKAKGNEVGELVSRLSKLNTTNKMESKEDLKIRSQSQRWVSIGKTDLQKGFMALVRSVAKPEFF